MKKLSTYIFLLLASTYVHAQDETGYRTPPKAMSDLLLAKPTPTAGIDSKAEWMLLSERNPYPSVEELARPEVRIAGLRINPNNYSLSRQTFVNNFTLKNIKTGKTFPITGLPAPLFAGGVSWSPDEHKIIFTQTNAKTVDLYMIDVLTHKATKINKHSLNTILGTGITWVDNNTVLYRAALKPAALAPAKPLMPKGPTIQQSLGKAAPSPTYEDLIKSPHDESLFEFYATSQLTRNKGGVETPIGKPTIYSSITVSPDKQFMLMRTIRKPFSYLVTVGGFPSTVAITDMTGKVAKVMATLPSSEGTPSGADNTQNVPRGFDWRDDEPATITWSQPLDSGVIKKKMDFHDAVYSLNSPFKGEPKELFKTPYRFRGITWGTPTLALVSDGLRSKQTNRTSVFNPSTGKLETLIERSTTDSYNNPGTPVLVKNKYGRSVIHTTDGGTKLLMNNTVGASKAGDLPFLAKFDLSTKKNDIIWRASEGHYEMVVDVLDPDKLIVLTRRESQTEVPNYFIKDLKAPGNDKQITSFANPYPQMEGVSVQKIFYKRKDGVDLTGDLYLPKGYNKEKDGPLPVLIWAYPREYDSAADAAQTRGSKDRFTTIGGGSPVFFVMAGYAVLNNAEMPIVAKEGKRPNDSFVEQLELNAEAAIGKLSDMGVGDKNRMAVGGHSYGAFMTANLLAHTKLFKAGLAESGAYNRTLTPFGFQNEDRTYWQEPKLYFDMSPFSYADKIKTPLLLIHGDADDNSGTFPINSERLFAAVKGLGGTVRFVYLPYEAHGYRGKENLLHKLWEQLTWMDTYVKGAK
ncbi:prolyl oligopeptidase family serine peptidase [Mucilaginibacter myungsuensis]|uniref:Prolyl oligopeptidase family serine peptidase n=1 Tax=Mucilaginibacter myungsuensis TaxID=649104 RepID=A0A929PVX3_9SPHI|nr:prolyl oligopeptidase family serine peptidase [Mucilaginibacter myungsuensis]MBE9660547.1 prolyl oligopeptidase family serine peptidase [Mucilaginibacter myungsuensis]MDN3600592.1 prolyl oligopeptidase family serine peptidase [Mucilaginibacter myungsuensis]